MAYIRTIPVDEADGELKEIYEQDLTHQGYVANYTKALSLRPKAIAAWRNLNRTIRARLSLRRYELVTLAAAVAMKCTY